MNPKMEMRQGDHGESLGGVGMDSGMLQAELPREIQMTNGREKQNQAFHPLEMEECCCEKEERRSTGKE